MNDKSGTRDIIVIGASAGGVEALKNLVRDLPADLPASIFVVLHIGATSHLAALLDRAGPLRAAQAKDGELIHRGRIYVAAPDMHLLMDDHHVLLRRGPRENLARPAIDPLFRSAACSFGGRVIGVVLTGSLSDGTAGLKAIKRCGGIAIAQDPDEAAVSDMPLNAQRHVDLDYCLPIAGMAELLARLTREPAGETPEIPKDIRLEAAIAAQELMGMRVDDQLGSPSPFSCPECHGALWEIADGDVRRYRCHTGHAFAGDVMLAAQDEEAERTMWTLLRSHQERAALARRMAEEARARNPRLAAHLQQRAADYDEDADQMRSVLAYPRTARRGRNETA